MPIMFVHIGFVRSTVIIATVWLIQAVAAKLNFESTRL